MQPSIHSSTRMFSQKKRKINKNIGVKKRMLGISSDPQTHEFHFRRPDRLDPINERRMGPVTSD